MGGKGEKKKAPTVAEIREPTARVRMYRTCCRLVMVVVVVVVLLKVGYEVIQNLQLVSRASTDSNLEIHFSLKLPANSAMTSESRVFCWVRISSPISGPLLWARNARWM